MSDLILTLRAAPAQAIDLYSITPDRLAGQNAAAMADVELAAGNRRIRLGDLFDIASGDTDCIVIRHDGARLLNIGAGMSRGRLRVEGAAGDYAGNGMSGGELLVAGDAGQYAGCGMTGGLLSIAGNAGDFAGGARPGQPHGMNGGILHIGGHSGARTGDRMRRGLLLIGGDAGDWCGSRMLAGTLIVRGATGRGAGQGMQRGTLLCHQPPDAAATFNDCGILPLPWLRLLARELARDPRLAAFAPAGTRARRLMGDLGNGGKGEILVLKP